MNDDFYKTTKYNISTDRRRRDLISVNFLNGCSVSINGDEDKEYSIIFYENENILIQDNGRGMTQEDFESLSKPYVRKEGQKETGTGLGLNISVAILNEHGFILSCEKNDIGTKMKITINK